MIERIIDLRDVKARSVIFPRFDMPKMATIAVVFFGWALRFFAGADQPLWLDETFTGAIAALPSFAEVAHQSFLDVNAPLYYFAAHAWALLFGISNGALRFPALLFGCICPLLCLLPASGISRRTRLLWCATLALWFPGIEYSQEARCYTLLLGLSILNVVCFMHLLDRPDLRRASAWAFVCCLAVLTHYYALVLVGVQAAAYLLIWRVRAVRTAPAALLFVPAVVWLVLHVQRIVSFAAPDIAWYRPFALADIPAVLTFTVGIPARGVLLAGLGLMGALAIHVKKHRLGPWPSTHDRTDDPSSEDRLVPVVVACSCAGAILVVGMAFLRPSLTLRYMIPFVPGILLGLVWCCGKASRLVASAPYVLIVILAIPAMQIVTARPPDDKVYNFQEASHFLMGTGGHDLVFFWDHPATLIEDPSQLAIVGGFFFKRAGVNVEVRPVRVARHEDPNPRLIAMARPSGTSILWIYDKSIHSTAARDFPPRVAMLDARFTCRDFGRDPIGIMACAPTGPTP